MKNPTYANTNPQKAPIRLKRRLKRIKLVSWEMAVLALYPEKRKVIVRK